MKKLGIFTGGLVVGGLAVLAGELIWAGAQIAKLTTAGKNLLDNGTELIEDEAKRAEILKSMSDKLTKEQQEELLKAVMEMKEHVKNASNKKVKVEVTEVSDEENEENKEESKDDKEV